MNALLKKLGKAFRDLSSRERILVSAVGALVVLALLWFGAVVPATDSAANASQRVAWSVSARKRVTRPSFLRVLRNEFSIALVLNRFR